MTMAMSPSATVRTAIELKKAIDSAPERLRPIGFCPSICDKWKADHYNIPFGDEMDEKDDQEYKTLIKELEAIRIEYHSPCRMGTLDAPFSLNITRAGCEFTGEIVPTHEALTADEELRLKKWFDGGAVSGYGDMLAQETRVDPKVRSAREIPATEFSVSPALLRAVEACWEAGHFLPARVRAEPYKIHVYGPQGTFKEHRDTPEVGLVGTFLVGLGDSTRSLYGTPELIVMGLQGWEGARAQMGAWVAFYPDVRHAVEDIREGYRAVIAFKLFQRQDEGGDPSKVSPAQAKIGEVLEKMPNKYGLLLEHQYSKGTTHLSGFDADLFAAARARTDIKTWILPVLIKFNGLQDISEGGGDDDIAEAKVFPLTEPHVDALVKLHAGCRLISKEEDEEEEEEEEEEEDEDEDGRSRSGRQKKPLEVSLEGTEAAWLEQHKVQDVPFYSDLSSSLVVWKRIEKEGAEYTGNQAMPTTEDSIYLSFAMVVLPKNSAKRKRESDEEEE